MMAKEYSVFLILASAFIYSFVVTLFIKVIMKRNEVVKKKKQKKKEFYNVYFSSFLECHFNINAMQSHSKNKKAVPLKTPSITRRIFSKWICKSKVCKEKLCKKE